MALNQSAQPIDLYEEKAVPDHVEDVVEVEKSAELPSYTSWRSKPVHPEDPRRSQTTSLPAEIN
jgi:hypothetical protein